MQVFEFRETPQPVIIMDYYRLGSVSKAEIGDEDSYISVLGQVLDGLKHLHAKGVVHRDLKPENLLLEKEPFFKIVISDFGLSNIATETTLLNTFCGTARYAAPEVFPFEGYGYGPSVDIWSWVSSSLRISTAFQTRQRFQRPTAARNLSGQICGTSGLLLGPTNF